MGSNGVWKVILLFAILSNFSSVNALEDFDVLHYSIDLSLSPVEKMVVGTTVITINTKSLSKLDLVLDKSLKINSVEIEEIQSTFSREGDIIKVHPKDPLSGIFSVGIVYEGALDVEEDGHSWAYMDEEVVYAVYESNWYPRIKGDRASGQVTIKVPAGWRAISNGMPEDSKDGRSYKWLDDSHNVGFSFAAGKYLEFQTYDGHLPISCYVLTPHVKCPKNLDNILAFFNNEFSKYPFKKLAIVAVEGNLDGGHSDNSLIIISSDILMDPALEEFLAHEIAHNWFGSIVTAKDVKSGKDLWLTEGFATYASIMYLEEKDPLLAERSLGLKRNEYIYFKNRFGDKAISAEREQQYGEFNLQNGVTHATVYSKGAWVLHMLRYLVGDETFKEITNNYLEKFSWQSAGIDDFRLVAEETSKMELSWFFDQWIHQTSLPEFLIEQITVKRGPWFYAVSVEVAQGGDLVRTPIDVTVVTREETLTKRVWIDSEKSKVHFRTEYEPLYVILDKDNWLLEKEKSNNKEIIRYPFNFFGLKLFLSKIIPY